MLAAGNGRTLRFRDMTIDVDHNCVEVAGTSHQIEPKPMEVLYVLASHNGEVVGRQALIDAVWGVAFGGDESLTRAISLLRKVLPGHIRTVPKRGYVFTADVETVAPAPVPPKAPWRWWQIGVMTAAAAALLAGWVAFRPAPISHKEDIVLLVKPFIPAGDKAAAVATVAMTTSLSRFDQVKVRVLGTGAAPDPDRDYTYVVWGSVVEEGGHSLLDMQLLDQVTGDTLWSDSVPYDSHATDTLAAELEPAAMIATKRRVQARPADQLSPWELILLGTWIPGADQEWLGPPDANSYWLWDRAIAKAPGFALAHASLAQVMASFALFDPPSDTPAHAERAARAAERALQLAPYDAGVLYQIALYDRYAGRRGPTIATLDQVLAKEPGNVAARIERIFAQGQCRPDSVAASAQLQALETGLPADDPRHWVILSRLADLALARGDYLAAQDYAARSRQRVRQIWSSVTLAAADAELGRSAEARQVGLEHKGQWPSLDYGRFAAGPLSRWCYGGDTRYAADAFRKLDAAVKSPG